MLAINQAFDAGNIEVIDSHNPSHIQLRIRPDHQSEFFQWFYFRVTGAQEQPLNLHFTNAKEAAFKEGWDGYQAFASYDQEFWFRVPSRFEEGELIVSHTPSQSAVYYAYFPPYSLDRHQQLIAQSQAQEHCQLHVLGQSVQGRDLDCLQIGKTEAKNKVWITARQHPGESMAQWCAEGLISRLLDMDDPMAQYLLQNTVFYIVPHANPDGSFLGHLRTNSQGINLNRVWNLPDEQAYEVAFIRHKMRETGCDLFLDLHGDEEIPYNFIAGQQGMPVGEHILQAEAQFLDDLIEANPDFQKEHGYEPDRFGEEAYGLASNWVGREFGIPAMTLEMPFKDCKTRPEPIQGWSAERSFKLGESLLHPIKRYLKS